MVPVKRILNRPILLLAILALSGNGITAASSKTPSPCGLGEVGVQNNALDASFRCQPWDNAVFAPECSLSEKDQIYSSLNQGCDRKLTSSAPNNSSLHTVRSTKPLIQWDVDLYRDLLKTYLEEGVLTHVQTIQTTMSTFTQLAAGELELRTSELRVASEQALVWWENSEYSSPVFWTTLYETSRDVMSDRLSKALQHTTLPLATPRLWANWTGRGFTTRSSVEICPYNAMALSSTSETCSTTRFNPSA